MDSLPKHLREDYYREFKKLTDSDKHLPPEYISINDILKAHYLICDYFEDKNGILSVYGVKSFNLLGSAVSRQLTCYEGKAKWINKLDIISTLFFGITKNHAFHDGNKRTALLILLHSMIKSGYLFDCKQTEIEELTVRVAANELYRYNFYSNYHNHPDKEVMCISHFLRRKTHKASNRYKSMTYHEFDQKLRKYDCFLGNPSGGHINVYKTEKKLFRNRKNTRVLQIGFPGWKSQIGDKSFKESLKATGLTKENGIDTNIFLEGNESMYRLIQEYEGPIKRLKDK